MQISVDLPDDAFAKEDAEAKLESRSLDMKSAPHPAFKPKPAPGFRLPVVAGRPVTQAELDRMLEEEGLP